MEDRKKTKNFKMKGDEKEMRINEKGITLIALIITIIILVILAAVSIRAVYNMGIVGHAINGTQDYAKAAKDEEEDMGKTGNVIEDAVAKVKEIQGGKDNKDNEDNEIDTANDGIPGEKILTDNLNAGDHIMIKLKGITNPVECVVLYDKTSEHASNGVQVITADTIGNQVTLGAGENGSGTGESGQDQWIPASMNNESNVEKAKWSYNNAIDNLNNLAKGYIDTNYVVSARCVGSDPDSPNDNSPYSQGIRGTEGNASEEQLVSINNYIKTLKYLDHNVVEGTDESSGSGGSNTNDLEQLDNLHIVATGSYGSPEYKSFWLASRYSCLINENNCMFEVYGCVVEYGDVHSWSRPLLYYDLRNRGDQWNPCSNTYGFRPCFTLKSGIYVSRISEDGTKGPGGLSDYGNPDWFSGDGSDGSDGNN